MTTTTMDDDVEHVDNDSVDDDHDDDDDDVENKDDVITTQQITLLDVTFFVFSYFPVYRFTSTTTSCTPCSYGSHWTILITWW